MKFRQVRPPTTRHIITAWAFAIAGGIMAVLPTYTAVAASQVQLEREQQFAAAATEFKVPKEVLLSLSYNQTRWENHHGQPSVSGGYGLMHLTDTPPTQDAKGLGTTKSTLAPTTTLREAASLLKQSVATLQKDDSQNIRGGAALLAEYAKQANQGKVPTSLGDWYGAVAKISGIAKSTEAQAFADRVYATMADGAALTTTDRQIMSLHKKSAVPDRSELQALGMSPLRQKENTAPIECPKDLDCRFVPARNAQNSSDPTDYGNYDIANRPKDMDIKYIVIHDTEGSYESAISWFQDARSYVAAQYVIRSSDGQVTQMVRNSDVGWHAGNWYMNMHSIGVEHEGFAASGGAWYTEAMYQSSAKLVRYLAKKYDIPMDRQHIIGHDQFAGLNPKKNAEMHTDPGPYWDWDHYMELLKAPKIKTASHGKAVTIAPNFQQNKQVVTDCDDDGVCTTLPQQGTNFVYLRTEPRANAPLVNDIALHPDGSAGTTKLEDTSARATSGQQFAVAEQRGAWTAVWFGGTKGWFYNPGNTVAKPAKAKTVTPKAGMASIPVYGRPTPEESAFKNGVAAFYPLPLQYKVLAGQKYVAYDKKAVNDYYQVLTFNMSAPGDGELIVGKEKYYPITFGHRQAYVKASDVQVVR